MDSMRERSDREGESGESEGARPADEKK
jgi:hypothetical protein